MKKGFALILASIALFSVVGIGAGCDNNNIVKNGDTVNIDFVGTINGVPFSGGSAKGYILVIGSGKLIPGFEEQIIGMKVGEVKDISVTFPLNYHVVEFRGQIAVFKITLNSIIRQ